MRVGDSGYRVHGSGFTRFRVPGVVDVDKLLRLCIQGYLAHKKLPSPKRTTIGPLACSYCRFLGGCFFFCAR